MAPERPGQGSIPHSTKQLTKDGVIQKSSSILEDFLEIKIKEELDFRQEEIIFDQDEYILKADVEEVVKYREGGRRKILPKREEDQDLTSLSWLQSNNLLKSKPLKLPESAKKHPHEESPTSDLAEETGSESSTSQSHSSRGSPPALLMDGPSVSMVEETRTIEKYPGRNYGGGKDKHHYSVPYDPQLHINSKPPYSFSCLIFMAIEDSHARALPVKEIYSWITDHFPYFNKAPTGWKNSVRHNLSLNKCFRKVDKAPNLGKGSLWIVDPQYRPNLLNALSKAPYHPCASLDRPAKAPILPPSALAPQPQDFISAKSQSRLPNPELFPYLSKRLAASEADRMNDAEDSDEDSLDDVDAATAMLELKHGQTRQQNKLWRKKLRLEEEDVKLVISTSPSEDHTYSVDRVANYKQRQPVSPDEAYGGGSDSNDETSQFLDENEESWSSDGAEQRNVASALLHLAGGSRKRAGGSLETTTSKGTPRSKKSNQRPLVAQKPLRKGPAFRSGSRRNEESTNHNNNNTDKYSRLSLKPKMAAYQILSNSR